MGTKSDQPVLLPFRLAFSVRLFSHVFACNRISSFYHRGQTPTHSICLSLSGALASHSMKSCNLVVVLVHAVQRGLVHSVSR